MSKPFNDDSQEEFSKDNVINNTILRCKLALYLSLRDLEELSQNDIDIMNLLDKDEKLRYLVNEFLGINIDNPVSEIC